MENETAQTRKRELIKGKKNHDKQKKKKTRSKTNVSSKNEREKKEKEEKIGGRILDGEPGSRVALGGEWLGGLLWKERRREGCIDCVRLVRRRADPTSCWTGREWGETRKGYKAAERARERKRERRRGGVSYRCEREGEEKT